MYKKSKFAGFTLIELMIALAIVGLLASFAYPSYTGFITRSQRATALTELMRIAQLQERNYIDQRTYVTLSALGFSADTIGIDDKGNAVSAGTGIYDITITPGATAFTIQATAKNAQTKDTGCTTLTINSAGARNPATCWRK